MTKNDFVRNIAERAEMTQAEARVFVKAFEDAILEDVFAAEDSVRFSFGTFSGYCKETDAREGRNPATGETIKIPAKTIHGYPKFKASAAAKA